MQLTANSRPQLWHAANTIMMTHPLSRFDVGNTLRCEMARKNMYIKDMGPGADAKRARTGEPAYRLLHF